MACQTKMNPKGVPLPNYIYYNAPINVLAKGGDLINNGRGERIYSPMMGAFDPSICSRGEAIDFI